MDKGKFIAIFRGKLSNITLFCTVGLAAVLRYLCTGGAVEVAIFVPQSYKGNLDVLVF